MNESVKFECPYCFKKHTLDSKRKIKYPIIWRCDNCEQKFNIREGDIIRNTPYADKDFLNQLEKNKSKDWSKKESSITNEKPSIYTIVKIICAVMLAFVVIYAFTFGTEHSDGPLESNTVTCPICGKDTTQKELDWNGMCDRCNKIREQGQQYKDIANK